MRDVWDSGEAYEPFVGRWSRQVAARFVADLGLPPGLRWLDVGCGTGALTAAVTASAAPRSVLGLDPSPGFVSWARAHTEDPRVRVEVGDAAALPEGEADAVVSGLVLGFLPDPAAAVGAMRRAAPGGTVAAYVWDYADGMQVLRRFWDAAVAVDPAAAPLDEAARFPVCRPERLQALWQQAGLTGVTTWAMEVPAVFADVDAYWQPFLGGQGPAPTYLAGLDPAHREAVRERLVAGLPVAEDRSVTLGLRAWAVRGSA